ncbi:MAG: hypothetical protein IKU86_04060 [Thermoguttaceae bacterium]|nr:hypothetical protein [Thermoguttaceae bacterium]
MNKTLKNWLLTPFNILYRISPTLTLRILFRLKLKSKLNLLEPKTFSEKINWLKLYYRNDLMVECVDKFAARGYIERLGFENHLAKLYWHGDDPEQIPFDTLPQAFVIKSTSGSGNNIIVKDKAKLNRELVKKKFRKWLKEKYLVAYGEWCYGKVKPSIVVEEFLSDGENFVPIDYKFFCFNKMNGNEEPSVGCIGVDLDRFSGHKRLVMDSEWNYLPDTELGFPTRSDVDVPKPVAFDEMCAVAVKLAKPFPTCRIDFYVIGDKFYIGEITFFDNAGFAKIVPPEFNNLMGSWIALPKR